MRIEMQKLPAGIWALDSAGAFIGPLTAVVLMFFFVNDIRKVLWIAVIPAFIAMVVLIFGVHEPERPKTSNPTGNRFFPFRGTGRLPYRYWLILGLNSIFTLARFSEAFLILRAQSVGLAIGFVPAIMIVMNAVYALTAYPAGILTDRIRPRIMLTAGLAVLIIADIILASARTPFPVFIGAALWGLHMGLTQGLFSKLVADHAPMRLRGTAFGIFNLATGIALLTASAIAGLLWSVVGAQATFITGAAFTALALIGLVSFKSWKPSAPYPDQAHSK